MTLTIQLVLKQNGCMIQFYEFGEEYMTPPPVDKQIPGNEKNYWID